jgi:predicted alpha/beta-fold hydrolase
MLNQTIIETVSQTPFEPHPALKNAHAQTIVSSFMPRRARLIERKSTPRVFEVESGVKVLAKSSLQPEPTAASTVLLVHGLEGSSESYYMLGTAARALAAGFNVFRLNTRNCGDTYHLCRTLYHAGLTQDLKQIVATLIERDRLSSLHLVGFSLGGNMVLKLAGELGDAIPPEVKSVVAVSPSIHLSSCADAIELRSNLVYQIRFMLSLRRSIRNKARVFPEQYDATRLRGIWSMRAFDDAYTAPYGGFRDSQDYYERASALPFIANINTPTLIIHAIDDPFIPFHPFEGPEIGRNPNVHLMAPKHGGHLGFLAATPAGEDRFWAEARAVQFVKLLSESTG